MTPHLFHWIVDKCFHSLIHIVVKQPGIILKTINQNSTDDISSIPTFHLTAYHHKAWGIIALCGCACILWSILKKRLLDHVRACAEISKKLNSYCTLWTKNTSLFVLPDMGHSLIIFAQGMSLHMMYSAFHKMQRFSKNFIVKTQNSEDFFPISIFLGIKTNYRLHKT